MTPTQIAAYNQGVLDVLDIARRSAAAIEATSRRKVHEAFAVSALEEIVTAGRALLLPEPKPDAPTPVVIRASAHAGDRDGR